MMDIDINLTGLLALFVFVIAAIGAGLSGIISLIVAQDKAWKTEQNVKAQRAFAYFIAALPLLLANLLAFVILYCIYRSNARETNNFLDIASLFVWLPLQPIVWIVLGRIISKSKK